MQDETGKPQSMRIAKIKDIGITCHRGERLFQNKKHALNQLAEVDELKSTENKDLVDGFCQSGLFAIVRKPNYATEQLVWISYYFFSVAASASATWPQSANLKAAL